MTYAKAVNKDEFEYYVSVNGEAHKGDYVALFMDGFLENVKIVEVLDELTALTSDRFFYEGVCKIDISGYLNRRKAELQRRKLFAQMEEQMKLGSFREKIRKNATITPEMEKLYSQYLALEKLEATEERKGTSAELEDEEF